VSGALTRRQALATAGAGLLAGPVAASPKAPLQIVGPWELGGLAPAQSGHLYLRLQVAETLLNAAPDGQPRPGLAAQWQVSADGLQWRLQLRAGARFHDGTPVDAASVLPSLQAARVAPALLSQAPLTSLQADGKHGLRFTLSRPFAALGALLAHASTVVLAPASRDAQGRVTRVLGSGPYRVLDLQPPQRLVVGWAGTPGRAPPDVTEARYLAAGRAETRALMAASGQADLAFVLDPASVARLRRDVAQPDRVRLASTLLPRVLLLKLNAGDARLADVRVRRALSLALDRPGIARALLREPDLAANQLLPPTSAAWHQPGLPPLAQDLTLARSLLLQAGWRQQMSGVEPGWLDAAGQPVELTLRTFPDRPELPLVATALQAQWRALGVPVRVAIGNSGDIPLGHRTGSLQLALLARNYATVPDPTATLAQDFGMHGTQQGGDWGALGWRSPETAAALQVLLQGSASPAQAAALRRQVVTTLGEELPVIPIAWYRLQVAVSPRLGPIVLDPLERSYHLDQLRWSAA
jgi:peptide/nickel transport system substrate-binding protein